MTTRNKSRKFYNNKKNLSVAGLNSAHSLLFNVDTNLFRYICCLREIKTFPAILDIKTTTHLVSKTSRHVLVAA